MLKLIPRYKQGNKSPDHDPNNPYHYHVNGQKVVITPEDWEKYKDDPTFKEVRAEVEAEQAAYPKPEYDEVENPVWRKAYQNLVNSVNLRGRSNYLQPLPQGYTRDTKGIPMDAQGNYYIPVETATNAPYFINQERGMMGHTVPVRYELQQMPERTIRQLKQPLPVDSVMNVGEEKNKAIENYMDKYIVKLPSLFESGEGVIELPNGVVVDIYNDSAFKMRNDLSYKKLGNARKYLEQYLSDYLGRPISFEYYNDIYDNQLILNSDEVEKFSKSLKKLQDYKTQMFLDDSKNLLSDMLKEKEYWTNEEINRVKKNIEILKAILNSNKPAYSDGTIPKKISRSIAEKKAAISISDLEKVGTFTKGGKLISKYLNGNNITTYPFGFNVYSDPTIWINWWYSNRVPLLINAAPEAQRSMHSYIGTYFKSYRMKKGKEYARDFINSITPILNQYSEASINPNFYGIKQLGSSEANENNEKLKQQLKSAGVKVGNNLDLIDYGNLLGKIAIKGETFPEDRIINYFTSDPSTVVHERIHAITPINVLSKHPIHKQIFRFESDYLKENNEYDNYLDDPSEIYSRLMLFRFNNKINPKRKYTILEIKNFRKLGKFKDNYLDRYTDDFLLHLFNDVAENNQLEKINYSKRGSKLIKR